MLEVGKTYRLVSKISKDMSYNFTVVEIFEKTGAVRYEWWREDTDKKVMFTDDFQYLSKGRCGVVMEYEVYNSKLYRALR